MPIAAIERTAFRKIAWRLMPLLTMGYIVNYLDRGKPHHSVSSYLASKNHEVVIT